MARKHLALGFFALLATVGPYYYFYSGMITGHKESLLPSQTQGNDNSSIWRQINPQWYVYSAYLDKRPDEPLLRIIAMTREQNKQNLYCHVWMTGAQTFRVVDAQKQELWIHTWDSATPNQYYHPYLLSCPLPRQREEPVAVAVAVDDPSKPSTNRINIPSVQHRQRDEFVVCLKPLNFKSDISQRLIEWLELQFLLGANAIFVYVHEVHPKTWRVLQHYTKLGKLLLLNYTLPGTENFGMWQKRRYEMAVYNDCLYRHIESHKFVVNLDLDEAIIPVHENSWSNLLANCTPAASLSARCVYFFDILGEDLSVPPDMHMLRHVYRSSQMAPPGFAQKSFFSTLYAEVVSNHFALRSVKPDVKLLFGLDAGKVRLHHYRKECPVNMEYDCKENYMRFWQRDTLLWKYKDRLLKSVQQVKQQLGRLSKEGRASHD